MTETKFRNYGRESLMEMQETEPREYEYPAGLVIQCCLVINCCRIIILKLFNRRKNFSLYRISLYRVIQFFTAVV